MLICCLEEADMFLLRGTTVKHVKGLKNVVLLHIVPLTNVSHGNEIPIGPLFMSG